MSESHAWSEHTAAYALGALDADERSAFEAHLAACARCQSEVASYHDAAGLIGFGAPVRTPPSGLRERVLAQARAVRPIASKSRANRSDWRRLATAALVVVALGALVLYGNERGRRTLAEADRDALTVQLRDSQGRLAQQDSLLAAVLAPDAQSATLASQGRPPSVRLYRSARSNIVVVAAHDLPPAPSGRTYQLWGIAAGTPVSLGTFNTDASGRATVALPVRGAARFELSAVTEEPAGGSPQPTTTPFLAGPWSES